MYGYVGRTVDQGLSVVGPQGSTGPSSSLSRSGYGDAGTIDACALLLVARPHDDARHPSSSLSLPQDEQGNQFIAPRRRGQTRPSPLAGWAGRVSMYDGRALP